MELVVFVNNSLKNIAVDSGKSQNKNLILWIIKVIEIAVII